MNIRPHSARRLAALASLTALAVVAAPTSAGAAAGGDVEVVNTETIQVYTDATGKVQSKRVYEQLTMTGTGAVDLVNPIETDGLRNLDEFGGFEVKDGQQVFETSVDGNEQLRTVSNYGGDLPLEVDVEYVLDGKTVDPEDVVGEDGELEVRYTVRNVTAQPQEVSFPDGSGGTVTKTVDVPIPLVGSLTTTTPANFTDVESEAANMAGDGKGGTKLSYTMTLFPPIGSDTAEFGYTATITDGVVPQTDISALPVNPLNVPTFKNAATSYQGGADTGARLAEGAGTIDENLLKLRDGAAELLAGLIKLNEGSQQLSAGLAGEAAPGARRLADGAGELQDGIGQIDDGAGKLADGAGQLDDGANELADGLRTAQNKAPALLDGLDQVREGLVKVDRGLLALSKGVAGVRQNPKYKELRAGLAKMLEGVGTKDTEDSLTWAVDQVRSGLSNELVPGLSLTMEKVKASHGQLTCLKTVLGDIKDGTTGNGRAGQNDACYAPLGGKVPPMSPIPPDVANLVPAPVLSALGLQGPLPWRSLLFANSVTQLGNALPQLYDTDVTNNEPVPSSLYEALEAMRTGLDNQSAEEPGAIQALTLVECALDSTSLGQVCDLVRPGEVGLRQGLNQVVAGVPTLVNTIISSVQAGVGSASDTPEDETLRGGMSGLIDGVDKMSVGGNDLLEGLGLLADGSGRLADGTGELSAGAGQLADGTGKAADGSGQLADGAEELSDGLGTAADGSKQLADGMGQAADGAPKLVDGAQRLSDEGTKQLVKAGEDTTQEYGELYATIAAGAERADADGMAFGAPDGAMGLTAYSFVIQGEDGESGRNLARGLSGLVLLGAGAGAFALRRRFI